MGRVVVSLLWSLALGPADAGVEIQWSAPDGCPDQAWVEARVARFLDRPLVGATVEPVSASIEVSAEPGGMPDGMPGGMPGGMVATVTLRTADREQRRVLRDDGCEVLAAAAAFMVAVAIDPDAALVDDGQVEGPAEPPAPAATETPVDDEKPASVVRPEDAAPSRGRPPVRGALGLRGGGAGGLLPGFAPALGITTAMIAGRARVEAFGDWYFERTVDLGASRTAAFRAWSAGAAGCFVPKAAPVEFPLCGGLAAGAMRGISRGVAVPGRGSIPWVAARAGASIAYVPSRFAAVRLGVDALVPLRRPQFTVENLGVVHETWPVVVAASLGVEVRFP